MSVLLWGLGIPAAVMIVQILWWRIRRPQNDRMTLFLMLLLAWTIFGISDGVSSLMIPEGQVAALAKSAYTLALAGAISTLYLITYAGLEAKSPSTMIVLAAHRSGKGITRKDAAELFSNEEFIVQRIEGLVRIGQLRRAGENLHLTLHGKLFLQSFLFPRKLMGLQHWGG